MNFIVTGGAGFIGSRIASALIAKGHEVTIVDDLSTGRTSNIPDDALFIKGDLSERKTYKELPRQVDGILHLAGQSSGEISFEDPVRDLERNTVSTLRLLKYAQEVECKKFVHASSMSVYGDTQGQPGRETSDCTPQSCYGIGKLASEQYIRTLSGKMSYTIFRMFNVYGPGQDLSNLKQGMVSIYLAQALKSQEILVKGSEDRYRDFIYIDDVVKAWVQSLETDLCNNRVLNLGTGTRTTVKELLQLICQISGERIIRIEGGTKGDQHGIVADPHRLLTSIPNTIFTPLPKGLRLFWEAVSDLQEVNSYS